MIALISFKDDSVIMPREEAESMRLQYDEVTNLGIRDRKLMNFTGSYYHYRDELTCSETEGGKTYRTPEGKEVENWYIIDRAENDRDYVVVARDNHLVDLNYFALNCKYPYYINRCVQSVEPTIDTIQDILNNIECKTAALDHTIDLMSHKTFNQNCNVHVGGGLITTYNELKLKENSCTDELQKELNAGWRIIAVCVQPDQRRPDYVLGRYNPKLDMDNCDNRSAKR